MDNPVLELGSDRERGRGERRRGPDRGPGRRRDGSADRWPDDGCGDGPGYVDGTEGTDAAPRRVLRTGGARLVGVLLLVAVIDEFPRAAATVLAPDIQATFGINDTVLLGMVGLIGVSLVLTTIPAAAVGDRIRRTRVVSYATFGVAFSAVGMGLAPNPFLMGLALIGGGMGVGARLPNASSLLADGYPLRARTKIFALEGMGRPLGQLSGPLFAGVVAAAIGGPEAWRWVFILIAGPLGLLAALALVLRDPPRGQYEQQEVLGVVAEADAGEPPVSLSAAFVRLRKVRSFYLLAVGIGVLGFALVSVPNLVSLILEDQYGYGPYTRGWMLAIAWSGALVTIPVVGVVGERLFTKDPPSLLLLSVGLLLGYGLFMVLAVSVDAAAPFLALFVVANSLQAAAFVATSPAVASAVPPRMRSQAFALVGLYVFLIGGFFGNLLAGALSDAFGERAALAIIVPPASLIGAAFIAYGSRYLRSDIALVAEELLEEHGERMRVAATADIPVIQARNLDVSYGHVQVLFGCSVDVRQGECLAILGTNGAGKSTLLRAILGLTLPERGVVRLHGRTITYADAEYRFANGIVAVRGGDGIFPGLSVRENLDLSFTSLDVSRPEQTRRIAGMLETFPALRQRLGARAGDLSGGQRQQLALARALVHEPDVLIIDELCLGLAPVVVQSLIEVVEQLRERGQTMVLVEPSMNIALSVADRAIYMERGRVVFDGTAAELGERGDLVQAVFMGAGGPVITALLGWSISAQVVFNGLVIGLVYSAIAAGIVLVYRSSGIVNFAQAAIGAFGVASFVVLFQNYDLPYPVVMALGVAGAALLGIVTELLVVRRLFTASRVVLLIATVGVAQLVVFLIVFALPDVQGGALPVAFDAPWAEIRVMDGLTLGVRQTSVILLVLPAFALLALFLTRTRLGLHIRAVADSPENAATIGVSPKRVSTIVWGLAAAFGAYTLIAGRRS